MSKISFSYFSNPENICLIENTYLKDDFQSKKTKKNRKMTNKEKHRNDWGINETALSSLFPNSTSLLSTSKRPKRKLEASSIFLYRIYRISSYTESNSQFQTHEKHSTCLRDVNFSIKFHFQFNFNHTQKSI